MLEVAKTMRNIFLSCLFSSLVSATLNHPEVPRCVSDECGCAVTDVKSPARQSAHKADCSSYLEIRVTPTAFTTTVTKKAPTVTKVKSTVTISASEVYETNYVSTTTVPGETVIAGSTSITATTTTLTRTSTAPTSTITLRTSTSTVPTTSVRTSITTRVTTRLTYSTTTTAVYQVKDKRDLEIANQEAHGHDSADTQAHRIPGYAACCGTGSAYASACQCWGVKQRTISLHRRTYTKTSYTTPTTSIVSTMTTGATTSTRSLTKTTESTVTLTSLVSSTVIYTETPTTTVTPLTTTTPITTTTPLTTTTTTTTSTTYLATQTATVGLRCPNPGSCGTPFPLCPGQNSCYCGRDVTNVGKCFDGLISCDAAQRCNANRDCPTNSYCMGSTSCCYINYGGICVANVCVNRRFTVLRSLRSGSRLSQPKWNKRDGCLKGQSLTPVGCAPHEEVDHQPLHKRDDSPQCPADQTLTPIGCIPAIFIHDPPSNNTSSDDGQSTTTYTATSDSSTTTSYSPVVTGSPTNNTNDTGVPSNETYHKRTLNMAMLNH